VLVLLAAALSNDVFSALTSMVDGNRAPAPRRGYVRASMAFVEGVTNALKRVALAAHESGAPLFSEGEVALLREESYRATDTGEVDTQSQLIPLSNNIRLALRAFAKAGGLLAAPSNYGGGYFGSALTWSG
jgi:hypothetical protein